MQAVISSISPSKAVIIGNGGAGAIGLLKKMAADYYAYEKSRGIAERDTTKIMWRAAHSFQNLRDFDTIDAAITYEPHIEEAKESKGDIIQPKTLFINHFELAAPLNDQLCIKRYIKNPVTPAKLNPRCSDRPDAEKVNKNEVVKIMEKIIWRTITNPILVTKRTYVFASRYNHSAMGEKDHTLFMLAIGNIVGKAMSHPRGGSGPHRRFDFKNDMVNSYFSPSVEYDQDTLVNRLYSVWMNHVKIFPTAFPWDMMKEASENGLYSSNDRAFFRNPRFGFSPNQYLSQIDDGNLRNVFINPAQIWMVRKHNGTENNRVQRFINWALSEEEEPQLLDLFLMDKLKHFIQYQQEVLTSTEEFAVIIRIILL